MKKPRWSATCCVSKGNECSVGSLHEDRPGHSRDSLPEWSARLAHRDQEHEHPGDRVIRTGRGFRLPHRRSTPIAIRRPPVHRHQHTPAPRRQRDRRRYQYPPPPPPPGPRFCMLSGAPMVEVLALPSRLDMDRLSDVLVQATSMLITAAMKASLITMKSSGGRAVNPEHKSYAAADAWACRTSRRPRER